MKFWASARIEHESSKLPVYSANHSAIGHFQISKFLNNLFLIRPFRIVVNWCIVVIEMS